MKFIERLSLIRNHLKSSLTSIPTKINNKNLLPYDLSGNPNSSNLIVFLHGYPDSNKLWDKIYPYHEKDNLVLRLSYPNYDKRVIEKWGLDFPQLIKGIKNTIEHVKEGKKYKIFVVSHDWGAALTYIFDKVYPKYFSNGIIFDIGYKAPQDLYSVSFTLFYQIYLALAFLAPKSIGTPMTHLLLDRFFVTKEYKPEKNISADINYMYYYTYQDLFYKTSNILSSFLLFSIHPIFTPVLLFTLYKYSIGFEQSKPQPKEYTPFRPSFPFAFIYGRNKPFMFHTDEMIKEVNLRENCVAFGVNTGHWVMNGNEEMINKLIETRLKNI